MTNTAAKPTLEELTARAKSEILADIASGRIPDLVPSFSALHNYVDANEYGGACEDSAPYPVDHDIWTDMQRVLNQWLLSGRTDDQSTIAVEDTDGDVLRVAPDGELVRVSITTQAADSYMAALVTPEQLRSLAWKILNTYGE